MRDDQNGVTLGQVSQYNEDKRRIEEAIATMKKEGGGYANPYEKSIIRLEGVLEGMRKAEWAFDV